MPHIRPVSDLRNKFTEISRIVHEGKEPVFLTKNGHGDMVVVEEFSSPQGAAKFLEKIEDQISNLQYFPLAGKEFIATSVLQDEYKVLIVEQYLVFYAVYVVYEDFVEIRRVISSKREYLKELQ